MADGAMQLCSSSSSSSFLSEKDVSAKGTKKCTAAGMKYAPTVVFAVLSFFLDMSMHVSVSRMEVKGYLTLFQHANATHTRIHTHPKCFKRKHQEGEQRASLKKKT